MSYFDSIEPLPEDPILSIPIAFAKDARTRKVNLGIGSYRSADGNPYILDCVRDAEAIICKKKINKEYLPIEGDSQLIKQAESLIFGKNLLDPASGKIFTTQTIGGTGALYTGGQFLSQNISKAIYIPNATWANHKRVFFRSGFTVNQYRYYDDRTHQFDFDRMCQEIAEMPEGSTILLHACCHNPTGLDPTHDQWMELSTLIKMHRIIPFFDLAYQGFKKSIDEDAFPIRYFLSQGHELLVANSFAKNFGLYGERVGTLSIVAHNKVNAHKAATHIKQIIRSNYSTPPRHGAEIVTEILSSETLREVWISELSNMRERLKEMRHTLASGLQAKGHGDWSYLKNQVGFFSFCGLNESQAHRLIKDYGIYMPIDGRINVSGLNGHNMDYVIDALLEVTYS